jgi:hypothetical protein
MKAVTHPVLKDVVMILTKIDDAEVSWRFHTEMLSNMPASRCCA